MNGLKNNKLNIFFKKILFLIKNKNIKKNFIKKSKNFLENIKINKFILNNNLEFLIEKNFYESKKNDNYSILKKIIHKKKYFINKNYLIFINGFFIKKNNNYNNFFIKKIKEINLEKILKKNNFINKDDEFINIFQKILNKKYIITISNYNIKSDIKIININYNMKKKSNINLSNYYLKINIKKNSIINLKEYFINENNNNCHVSNKNIILNDNSKLNYTSIYCDKKYKHNYTFSNLNIKIYKKSIVNNNTFMLNSSNVYLNNFFNIKGLKSKLYNNCISYSKNNCHYINSIIKHNSNYSQSYQLYKSVSINKGNNIFNNLVKIRKNISFIKGNIYSNGLICNNNSSIIINPYLKILSRKVDFKHGISVGNIDYNILFYLQSRSISYKNSIKIIYLSFYYDILNKIIDKKLKDYLLNKIIKIF